MHPCPALLRLPPSHRMPKEHGGDQAEPSDEPHDVARVIVVSIAMSGVLDLPCPIAFRPVTGSEGCYALLRSPCPALHTVGVRDFSRTRRSGDVGDELAKNV